MKTSFNYKETNNLLKGAHRELSFKLESSSCKMGSLYCLIVRNIAGRPCVFCLELKDSLTMSHKPGLLGYYKEGAGLFVFFNIGT